jgi:flavoprotein
MSGLPIDVVEYCEIHAHKMSDEGWHKTAIILEEAAKEIIRLRKLVDQLKGECHEDQ